MKSQAIIKYGAPLQEVNNDTPQPQGSEVLIKTTHCGVCHSDVHLHDGYFDLGGDKKLDISESHQLPFTLGHEIEGEVVALGPDAVAEDTVKIGDQRVVFPWIGCGECPVCASGEEQMCARPKALGINVAGGYSDYVLVPHSRYLLDYTGIPEGLAATYMCSGLTAYGALKKIGTVNSGESIAIVGLGGVGMMGLQFALALFPQANIVAVDIDPAKLQAAAEAGAAKTYNSAEEGAGKQLFKDTGGGVFSAIDFVGSERSLNFANRALRKGGKCIIVGLFGGRFSMPIPMFPMRAISLGGSYVGSLSETKEMLELVKAGKVAPIPIEERPLEQAGKTLDDLRQGNVLGRVVLKV